jgi:hypothetical protein
MNRKPRRHHPLPAAYESDSALFVAECFADPFQDGALRHTRVSFTVPCIALGIYEWHTPLKRRHTRCALWLKIVRS